MIPVTLSHGKVICSTLRISFMLTAPRDKARERLPGRAALYNEREPFHSYSKAEAWRRRAAKLGYEVVVPAACGYRVLGTQARISGYLEGGPGVVIEPPYHARVDEGLNT